MAVLGAAHRGACHPQCCVRKMQRRGHQCVVLNAQAMDLTGGGTAYDARLGVPRAELCQSLFVLQRLRRTENQHPLCSALQVGLVAPARLGVPSQLL